MTEDGSGVFRRGIGTNSLASKLKHVYVYISEVGLVFGRVSPCESVCAHVRVCCRRVGVY